MIYRGVAAGRTRYFRIRVDASFKAQVAVKLFQFRDRVEDTKKAKERDRLTSGTSSRTGDSEPSKRRRRDTNLVKDRRIPVNGLGVSACQGIPSLGGSSCHFTSESDVRVLCTSCTPVRRGQALSRTGPVLSQGYVPIS